MRCPNRGVPTEVSQQQFLARDDELIPNDKSEKKESGFHSRCTGSVPKSLALGEREQNNDSWVRSRALWVLPCTAKHPSSQWATSSFFFLLLFSPPFFVKVSSSSSSSFAPTSLFLPALFPHLFLLSSVLPFAFCVTSPN